jgi:GAF domain-containing protein
VLSNGAIVAPLVTPGGCVGVMAAEVRHEREQQEPVRAVAAIIAAQLATLIGVTPSQVKRAAGAE